jgi:hypothetical protein
MNANQSVATTVPAGAGTADNVVTAGAAADAKNNTDKSCQTAGKEVMKEEAKVQTSAATAVEAQPLAAANVGAQAQAGATTKVRTGESAKEKAKPVMILFSNMGVSKWNESHGSVLDPAHVKDLMEDIRRNKLMHPVTLTCGTDPAGPKFTILTGARRVAALALLRGPDSGLRFGEFKIHENLDESNPKCLDYSVAENTHRYGRSVIDRALFFGRMISENKVDQAKLAAKFNMRREVVNRLDKLSKSLNELPESWRKDLSCSPKSGGKELKKSDLPKITLTHWVEIAGKIGDGEISPEIRKVMEKAHAKRWSASRLRRELNGKGSVVEDEAAAKVVSAKEARLTKINLVKLCERLQGKSVNGDEGLIRVLAAIDGIKQQAVAEKAKAKKAAAPQAAEAVAANETPAAVAEAAETAPVEAAPVAAEAKGEVAAGSEVANDKAA